MQENKIISALFAAFCAEMTPEQLELRKENDHYFDRLCQAVGNREADNIWFAAQGMEYQNDLICFSQGLRLGAQLMRWVLEEG